MIPMRKLRDILLTMLVVVPLLLWAGSYVLYVNLDHCTGTEIYSVHVGSGGAYFMEVDRADAPAWRLDYGFDRGDYYPAALRERWRSKSLHYFDRYTFAGFGAKPFAPDSVWTTSCGMFRVPFWFVTVACVPIGLWILLGEARKRAASGVKDDSRSEVHKPLRKGRW